MIGRLCSATGKRIRPDSFFALRVAKFVATTIGNEMERRRSPDCIITRKGFANKRGGETRDQSSRCGARERVSQDALSPWDATKAIHKGLQLARDFYARADQFADVESHPSLALDL